jgi:hypothetical protein
MNSITNLYDSLKENNIPQNWTLIYDNRDTSGTMSFVREPDSRTKIYAFVWDKPDSYREIGIAYREPRDIWLKQATNGDYNITSKELEHITEHIMDTPDIMGNIEHGHSRTESKHEPHKNTNETNRIKSNI